MTDTAQIAALIAAGKRHMDVVEVRLTDQEYSAARRAGYVKRGIFSMRDSDYRGARLRIFVLSRQGEALFSGSWNARLSIVEASHG